MNEKLQKILQIFKSPRLIIAAGIIGIALIFLSSFFPSEKKTVKSNNSSIESYTETTEKNIEEIVRRITGSKDVRAVITLETGITYNYADEVKTADDSKTSSGSADSSKNSEQKKTVITDAEGNEKGIVINEFLPQIRGVAVVYGAANDEKTNERIEAALKAALSVSSKQIFIYGNGGQ